jgi:hypothetical protein
MPFTNVGIRSCESQQHATGSTGLDFTSTSVVEIPPASPTTAVTEVQDAALHGHEPRENYRQGAMSALCHVNRELSLHDIDPPTQHYNRPKRPNPDEGLQYGHGHWQSLPKSKPGSGHKVRQQVELFVCRLTHTELFRKIKGVFLGFPERGAQTRAQQVAISL